MSKRLRLYDRNGYAGLGLPTYNRGDDWYVVAAVSYRQALYLAHHGIWDTFGHRPGIVLICREDGHCLGRDAHRGA
jgi:hypothetical protein